MKAMFGGQLDNFVYWLEIRWNYKITVNFLVMRAVLWIYEKTFLFLDIAYWNKLYL